MFNAIKLLPRVSLYIEKFHKQQKEKRSRSRRNDRDVGIGSIGGRTFESLSRRIVLTKRVRRTKECSYGHPVDDAEQDR